MSTQLRRNPGRRVTAPVMLGGEVILGLTNRNDEEMIATRTVLIEDRKDVVRRVGGEGEEGEGGGEGGREGGRKAPHNIEKIVNTILKELLLP